MARERPELCDWEVLTALEAVMKGYRAMLSGEPANLRPMAPLVRAAYERIQAVCERCVARASIEALYDHLLDVRQTIRAGQRHGGRRSYLDHMRRRDLDD